MLQVAARMEAGHLLDGLGQGVDQAAGGVGGLGQHPRAELGDKPGGAVATAGAGAIGGTQPIEHDGQAGDQDPGPVLVRRVGAGGLGGEGGAHQARHTAASLMIHQGASIKAVQKQLGHATASITLDTYGHLFPSELEALASLARTQRGPTVVPIHKGAGQ